MLAVSYNKLFKLLIDKSMKKRELCEKAGISTNSIAQLGRGDNVTIDIIARICAALGCKVDDILEIFPD